MKARNITEDEFITIIRGIESFDFPYHGELTKYTQSVENLELHYGVSYKKSSIRISHLRVLTKWDKATLTKPINLILTNDHKKDFYMVLKSLSFWK